MTTYNAKYIMEELQKPFKPDEIEWLVKNASDKTLKGLALPYVTNRAIQKRLDDVVGINNWKNEFIQWKDKEQLCGISIRIGDEWITKYDGAADTNIDGTKGGLSGSMKRAAVQWGIGRYLYNMPDIWTDVKVVSTSSNGKKSYKVTKRPSIPKEFLPSAYKVKVTAWEDDINSENKNELPEPIQKCLQSFSKINVSKEDIENYLQLEIDMISDRELKILRDIYISIVNKKKAKEDYFFEPENNSNQRNTKTLKLEEKLQG